MSSTACAPPSDMPLSDMPRLRTDFDPTSRTLTLEPRGRFDAAVAGLARSLATRLAGAYDVLVIDGSAVTAVDDGALEPLAETAARLRPRGVVFSFRRLTGAMALAVDGSALFPATTADVVDLRDTAATRAP